MARSVLRLGRQCAGRSGTAARLPAYSTAPPSAATSTTPASAAAHVAPLATWMRHVATQARAKEGKGKGKAVKGRERGARAAGRTPRPTASHKHDRRGRDREHARSKNAAPVHHFPALYKKVVKGFNQTFRGNTHLDMTLGAGGRQKFEAVTRNTSDEFSSPEA
ncbi:hypothetical protein PTSG_10719 [Salpingoeca rosetta]|uniref:Uncharacterized protein n=1 Tax=Salpingoeca rosetta (strain ATCC 50818 / BSB-021) TaxID=946362 RepID=F2UQ68_SALR5|nr:uncharacterized protein PTSG_10719 [Salpingoeca rosetta]EGD79736.1 hypothetical protein PTSG_10719 [Salpingoeca rosetta]|eukprot:XP_004988685.1 hypothetical protein PTSG_10719 [Salpingoeca rosetta]